MTLPMALIPVVPNVPGFYLLYRAWSNWKAYEGGKHLNYLLKNDQLTFKTQSTLDTYFEKLTETSNPSAPAASEDDCMIIDEDHIDTIVSLVDAREMAPELHRAVRQVKKDILKEEHTKEA